MKDNGSIIEILKTISMFNIDKDFQNYDAKDYLSILFRKLVMSEDANAKDFMGRFLDNINKIIKDMDIDTNPPKNDDENVTDNNPQNVGSPPVDEPITSEPITDGYRNILTDITNRFLM